MRPPDDALRLRHMLEAAQKAAKLVQGKQSADLDRDETLALALTRLLEIIGEAASGVQDSLRAAHPEIPWKQVIGARHRLIHGYFDVDHDIVSSVITSKPAIRYHLKTGQRGLMQD